jgi:hypothetical protein
MERPNLSHLFSRRAKFKLRLILLANMLCQLAAFAALAGFVLSPMAAEIPYVPDWSPWAFVAILCFSIISMCCLVCWYAEAYYKAEREMLEKESPKKPEA